MKIVLANNLFDVYIDSNLIVAIQNYEKVDRVYVVLSTQKQKIILDLVKTGHEGSIGIYKGEFQGRGIGGLFYILRIFLNQIKNLPLEKISEAVISEFVNLHPPVKWESIVIVDKNGKEYVNEMGKWLTSFDPHLFNNLLFQNGTYVGALSKTSILVIDSKGRRVGSVYENGVFIKDVNEIHEAFYTGHGVYPSVVFVPANVTIDRIIVNADETGNFTLCVVELEGRNVKNVSIINSTLNKGECAAYRYVEKKLQKEYLVRYEQYWRGIHTRVIFVALLIMDAILIFVIFKVFRGKKDTGKVEYPSVAKALKNLLA